MQKKKAEQKAMCGAAGKKRGAQTELERTNQSGPGSSKQFQDQQEKED